MQTGPPKKKMKVLQPNPIKQIETCSSKPTVCAKYKADYEEKTALFKLRLGVATSSEGIPCARSAGVPQAALQRAETIKECVRLRRPIEWAAAESSSSSSSSSSGGRQRKKMPPLLRQEKHRKLLQLFLQTEDWTLPEPAGVEQGDGQDLSSSNKLATLLSFM